MAGYGEGLYGGGVYGGGAGGVPFLPHALTDARLAVEIAWGADLGTDAATWAWSDVTADVRQGQGIETTLGSGDEASSSQPATCTVTLDNTGGAYSLGGQSPNWPNVRRGTPVRVRVDPDGAGFDTVFLGFADGFTPEWNLAGTVPDVHLSASGTLRRLIQGAAPLQSAIRRALPLSSAVIAYWPCEEGRAAQRINAEIGSDLVITGTPRFEGSDVFACSAPLPLLAGSSWLGPVGRLTSTGAIQIRWLIDIPVEGTDDDTQLIGLGCSGTASRWEVRYETGTGGTARVRAFDGFGNQILNQGISAGLDGFRGQIGLQLRQVGGDVEWDLDLLRVGATASAGFGSSIGSATIGGATAVTVNRDGGNADVTIGHIAVYDASTPEAENIAQLNAYTGDYVTAAAGRLARLCDENAVPLTAAGSGETLSAVTDRMGPQPLGTLVELLRECETADQGTLYDGVSNGLTYTTRRLRENRAADLTISAADAQLASPFGPVDDDQRTRNRVEARRAGGSSTTLTDVDGPLGSAAVGLYDTTITVNTLLDDALRLFAGWLLALGTVEGYRYPTLTIDFRATPALAPAWLAIRPGYRIDITDLDQVLPGHPTGTLSLLVEGKADSISATGWTGTARCSAYAPWRIGVVTADAGDTGEYVQRLGTDGAVTTADRVVGATTLPVFTGAGPGWTTTVDDYPLLLDVGGIQVRATACSGGVGSQTFTVDPLPAARVTGMQVSLWTPTLLGL